LLSVDPLEIRMAYYIVSRYGLYGQRNYIAVIIVMSKMRLCCKFKLIEEDMVPIKRIEKKTYKYWLLVGSIFLFSCLTVFATSLGFQYLEDVFTDAIPSSIQNLFQYELITLQSINSIALHNVAFGESSEDAMAMLDRMTLEFNVFQFFLGSESPIIQNIYIKNITFDLLEEEEDFNQLSERITDLRQDIEMLFDAENTSPLDEPFSPPGIYVDQIMYSYEQENVQWNGMLSDFSYTPKEENTFALDSSVHVDLRVNDFLTVFVAGELETTIFDGFEEFEMEINLGQIDILGLKISSQRLRVQGTDTSLQVMGNNEQSDELEISGNMFFPDNSWSLRMQTNALEANRYLLDTENPISTELSTIRQFNLTEALIGESDSTFSIATNIEAEGTLNTFEYSTILALTSETKEEPVLLLDAIGNQDLLTINNARLSQSEENSANFSGTMRMNDRYAEGILEAQSLTILPYIQNFSGMLNINVSPEGIYSVVGFDLFVNNLLVENIDASFSTQDIISNSSLFIELSQDQILQLEPAEIEEIASYRFTTNNIRGKTIAELAKIFLDGDSEYSEFLNYSQLDEIMVNLEADIWFDNNLLLTPSIGASAEVLLRQESLMSMDFVYANNIFTANQLHIQAPGQDIPYSASFTYNLDSQDITGTMILEQYQYALDGLISDQLTRLQIMEEPYGASSITIEYNAASESNNSLTVQIEKFSSPFPPFQNSTLDASLLGNITDNEWSIALPFVRIHNIEQNREFTASGSFSNDSLQIENIHWRLGSDTLVGSIYRLPGQGFSGLLRSGNEEIRISPDPSSPQNQTQVLLQNIQAERFSPTLEGILSGELQFDHESKYFLEDMYLKYITNENSFSGDVNLSIIEDTLNVYDSQFSVPNNDISIDTISYDFLSTSLTGFASIRNEFTRNTRQLSIDGTVPIMNLVQNIGHSVVPMSVQIGVSDAETGKPDNTFLIQSPHTDTNDARNYILLRDSNQTIEILYQPKTRQIEAIYTPDSFGSASVSLSVGSSGALDGTISLYYLNVISLDSVNFFDVFEAHEGIASGTLSLEGFYYEPVFSGKISVNGVRGTTIFSPEALGPANIEIVFDNNRVFIPEFYLVNGKGSAFFAAEFFLDDNELKYYRMDIKSDDPNGIHIKYLFAPIYADGFARGEVQISGGPDTINFTGGIKVDNAEFSLILDGDPFVVDSLDLTILAGDSVRFVWPFNDSPILRMVAYKNQALHLTRNNATGKFRVDGNLAIRSGDIVYFNRLFRLREGNIQFVDRQNELEILVSHVGVSQEFINGQNTSIFLTALQEPLITYSPQLSSNSDISGPELLASIGLDDDIDNSNSLYNLFGFLDTVLLNGSPSGTSEALDYIRTELGVDTLDFRFSIIPNLAYQLYALDQTRTSLNRNAVNTVLSTIFHNAYFTIGNSITDYLYAEAFLHLREKENLYASQGNLDLFTEIHFALQTPLYLLDWRIFPTSSDQEFIRSQEVGFSWDFSLE